MIRKVLGFFAVVLLVCVAVVAYSAPQAAMATGPPTETSASEISICFRNVAIGVFFNNTALFMGADKTDEGLLKGPHTLALMKMEPRAPSLILFDTALTEINIMIEPASGTGVDALRAGKTDAALFMGEESMAPLRGAHVALIHAPPSTLNMALFCIDFS